MLSMLLMPQADASACTAVCPGQYVRKDRGVGYLQGGGQAEGHNLRHPQLTAFVKDDVVVYVHHPASLLVQENVV